ncbi:TniQ family protein [Rhodanobacter umsongensis]
MQWPFPINPNADELLSSFLVRAAHRHGLAPYRFCAYHFPGEPVWNRDIDRSASDALLEAIAEKAALPLKDVVGMTMRGIESTLGSHGLEGTAPWLNTVGIYHRLRRRWGLQFCPVCLAEQPVFYRSWRLSFVVTCRQHDVYLRDACPHCDAPLAIHRQRLSVQLCHSCSRPLTHKLDDCRPSPTELSRAQARYESALTYGSGKIGTQIVCPSDLFNGTHVLMNLIKPPRLSNTGDRQPRRLPLELGRTEVRAHTLLQLETLLAQWPDGFKAVACERHLTQRSFARWLKPGWLATAVCGLPKGRARSQAAPRGQHLLRSRLNAARRHDVEWRTVRAELLWLAATQ